MPHHRLGRSNLAVAKAERWLVGSFTRRRKVKTSDGAGGWTEVDSDLAVVGNISTSSMPSEFVAADRLESQIGAMFFTKLNLDIKVEDLIIDASSNSHQVIAGPIRETFDVIEGFVVVLIGASA